VLTIEGKIALLFLFECHGKRTQYLKFVLDSWWYYCRLGRHAATYELFIKKAIRHNDSYNSINVYFPDVLMRTKRVIEHYYLSMYISFSVFI